MKYLAMFGIIGGTGSVIWLGIHFGSRWIDKMLGVQPPFDPSKPIVRPMKDSRNE